MTGDGLGPSTETLLVKIAEMIQEDPGLLRAIEQTNPELFDEVAAGLEVLASRARSSRWRDPRPGYGGRPEQLMPGTPGSASDRTDWLTWLLMGGRGSGKSRTGAEAIAEMAMWDGWTESPRGALVGQTLDAVRIDMVENTLLQVLPPESIRQWNRGPCELWLANGCYLKGYSSEAPRKLRGPNFHFAWADELATWQDAHLAPGADSTFSNLKLATRAHANGTWDPRIIATTTPRPVRILRNPDPADPLNPGPGLVDDRNTVVTSMTTLANLDNLARHYISTVVRPLEGTRLYSQEILGELLDERLGALWSYELVERMTVPPSYPDLHTDGYRRVVVAVDPSVGAGMGDECGIVVAGKTGDGRVFVLDDASLRGRPEVWVRRVEQAFRRWDADVIVVEINQGGELVEQAIGRYAPNLPIVTVRARKGKQLRAESVSVLCEAGKVYLAGQFPELTRQMRTWNPEEDDISPDRVDALVYAVMWLLPAREGLNDMVLLGRGRRR